MSHKKNIVNIGVLHNPPSYRHRPQN